MSEVVWFSVSDDFCQPIVIHPVYAARFLILEGFHAPFRMSRMLSVARLKVLNGSILDALYFIPVCLPFLL